MATHYFLVLSDLVALGMYARIAAISENLGNKEKL
nr:MAG TPA: hypothetical protein [Caudoviricetes sp.]